MPALAKPPEPLPRFVPHNASGASAGADLFSNAQPNLRPSPTKTTSGETVDRLAHDARNVLSGLMLYSELLATPGVLSSQHSHYAQDLQTIIESAAQIVERLVAHHPQILPASSALPLPSVPVCDLASDLRHLQPLLAAIAGPATQLSIATLPCAGRTALAVEDLTRILVNLVRNAGDAMPNGGHIRIAAQYGDKCTLTLTVTDDGPGIPEPLRDQIFELGFTTRSAPAKADWPTARRRGLGLNIVRNLVEAAGGTIRAISPLTRGAQFEITLPITQSITSGTCAAPPNSAFAVTGA